MHVPTSERGIKVSVYFVSFKIPRIDFKKNKTSTVRAFRCLPFTKPSMTTPSGAYCQSLLSSFWFAVLCFCVFYMCICITFFLFYTQIHVYINISVWQSKQRSCMMHLNQRTEEYNFIRLLHKIKVQEKRKLNNLLLI